VDKRYWPEFLERFFQIEASSGVALVLATAAALLWANSPGALSYQHLWELPVPVGAGGLKFVRSLHFWISDGAMALFFLLVGLEVRRERRDGALADVKVAFLPVAAALGGVIVPALLFTALNPDPGSMRGWAVPTATDIAFAIGLLQLLGPRVPPELRVLLLTIAIVDDIAAILIIAFFYAGGIGLEGLLIACVGIVGLEMLRAGRLPSVSAYVLAGVIVWIGLLRAGVHPAVAGFIVGLCIPAPSADRLEQRLHPWVAFGVMPLFALANAGVAVASVRFQSVTTQAVVAGIVAGLVLGKPLGIMLMSCACIRLRWCSLPAGVDGKRLLVIACLAGIGFTMALFISDLAFADERLAAAKLAIVLASGIAGLIGLCIGRWLLPARE
jgi:NhaA family Na+:H+ antiporter